MSNIVQLVDAAQEPRQEFTDDALALAFADAYAGELRYVAALGKWMVWDGRRWLTDETLIARHKAREICRRLASRCNHKKTAKTIASAKTIAAVERLAQADRRIASTVDQWDADPWLLNTPAGSIDLKTGSMGKHDPGDCLTKITGVAPDFEMATPIWTAFLMRAMNERRELVDYLQRVAGYSLTGSTEEHALFFNYGRGANGKSTFLDAITGCAGDYHRAAPIETFTASNHDRHPTDLAGLRGARMVTAIETEEGRRWAESRIKALTGGDKISARFMRQDFFVYTPQFKLIIAGNHKPGLRSIDEAIRRRFNLIPWTVTIPIDERDKQLPAKLKEEWPGILAWMIEGCMKWLEVGLAPPDIVTEATAAYLESEDAVAAWIEECSERNPAAWEKSSDLFASWTQWATKAGEYVGSQKRFAQLLENKQLTFKRQNKARGYLGLRLHSIPDGYGSR
jgi:putative DNA primase/helicase